MIFFSISLIYITVDFGVFCLCPKYSNGISNFKEEKCCTSYLLCIYICNVSLNVHMIFFSIYKKQREQIEK